MLRRPAFLTVVAGTAAPALGIVAATGAARAAIEATGICRDAVKRSSVGTAGYAEIGLRAAARLTMRRTGLPRSLALAAIVLLTLSVFGSALWVFGATVGVLLAAPLTLFVMASVELLYVQEGLGELPEPKATNPSLGAAAVEV